jgi:hypothetical protein
VAGTLIAQVVDFRFGPRDHGEDPSDKLVLHLTLTFGDRSSADDLAGAGLPAERALADLDPVTGAGITEGEAMTGSGLEDLVHRPGD